MHMVTKDGPVRIVTHREHFVTKDSAIAWFTNCKSSFVQAFAKPLIIMITHFHRIASTLGSTQFCKLGTIVLPSIVVAYL